MKKYIVAAVLIMTAGAVVAEPQTYSARSKTRQSVKRVVKKKTPPPLQKEQVRGVIVRAFGPGNNPVQMINPKAPAKYGTAQQSVVVDPETGKWKGIKLVEIVF